MMTECPVRGIIGDTYLLFSGRPRMSMKGVMIKAWFARATRENGVFLFLLGYSWLSLLPPALALMLNPAANSIPLFVFAVAVLHNVLLSAFYPRLNRLVLQRPISFGMDLLLAAVFIAWTGGTHSPYYLFALGPILAGAFFFQMRGGLIAASTFVVLYLSSLGAAASLTHESVDILAALTQIVGFMLIAILFGYPSVLLDRIQHASSELARAHSELVQKTASLEHTNRELQSIHSLGLAMQSSSTDVFDVQERILTTITGELEFERAMLALVEPESNVLLGWLTHRRSRWYEAPDGLFPTFEIPLRRESGLLAQVLLDGKVFYVADAAPPTKDDAVNSRLDLAQYAILPLVMRDHPVGVIVVDNPDTRAPITQESLRSLDSVANQAALALGSTKLCIERAQRLAVEEERNRIAMEIHDTASQSLFGIVYALDACTKLLPGDPQEVKSRLEDTRDTAQRTMNDLRRSVYDIWVGELNSAEFTAELRSHLIKLDAPKSLRVEIVIDGEMNSLSTTTRRNLLRIAEEGLANVVKHSQATFSNVRLTVSSDEATLRIEDNGRGFDRGNGIGAGFGLKSIHERARAIGAEMQLDSQVGLGTRLQILLRTCLPTIGEGTRGDGFVRQEGREALRPLQVEAEEMVTDAHPDRG
jgi:signal transduction histidine kinase